MNRPLPKFRDPPPKSRPSDGHAGLWFDKFCDRWSESWDMKARSRSPKLDWIDTVNGNVGAADQIGAYALRLARLIGDRGGRFNAYTTESRFVTGLGRSHPVENGFAWHPTLGTPYLPGSSVKGMVRAWARQADPSCAADVVGSLLGDRDSAGKVSFLDAVPIVPVQLETDVMTPHYAGWTVDDPPGDWRSPTPIPFLVAAAGTTFLFGVVPCRSAVGPDHLASVMSWLDSVLCWAGAGAKTAVGYGRFARDEQRSDELKMRMRAQDAEERERERAELEARRRAEFLETLSPVEREIEEFLGNRPDKNMPEVTAVVQAVEKGRWTGGEKLEAAKWLRDRMQLEKRWKESSQKKSPAKDRDHQNTLRVRAWLAGR